MAAVRVPTVQLERGGISRRARLFVGPRPIVRLRRRPAVAAATDGQLGGKLDGWLVSVQSSFSRNHFYIFVSFIYNELILSPSIFLSLFALYRVLGAGVNLCCLLGSIEHSSIPFAM